MKVISKTPQELGQKAAKLIAEKLNAAIRERGEARVALSTGMSQFETIAALIKQDVDWSKVTMFHLDEYVNLSESHPASFRKYLKERFTSKVPLKRACFISGEGDLDKTIEALNREIGEGSVDVGVIGIGENAHIAFNDPPADFDIQDAYYVNTLDERCRKQQVGEGWFPTVGDVPEKAITMSVKQIMRSKSIISSVPHKAKAEAVYQTLTAPEITPKVPATKLREHGDWTLFLDGARRFAGQSKYENKEDQTDMSVQLIRNYLDKVEAHLENIFEEEQENILAAAKEMAKHVANNEIVHIYGPGGSSGVAAMEIFSRAGGLACINAILDCGTLPTNGGNRSMQVERLPGFGKIVMNTYGQGR